MYDKTNLHTIYIVLISCINVAHSAGSTFQRFDLNDRQFAVISTVAKQAEVSIDGSILCISNADDNDSSILKFGNITKAIIRKPQASLYKDTAENIIVYFDGFNYHVFSLENCDIDPANPQYYHLIGLYTPTPSGEENIETCSYRSDPVYLDILDSQFDEANHAANHGVFKSIYQAIKTSADERDLPEWAITYLSILQIYSRELVYPVIQ